MRYTYSCTLAQARISQNLIQNLPARAACENFREICLCAQQHAENPSWVQGGSPAGSGAEPQPGSGAGAPAGSWGGAPRRKF